MNLAVFCLCVAVLLSCNVLVQSRITTLYPTDSQDWSLFPYGAGDVETSDEDDFNWFVDDIGHNIIFFGNSYDRLRVNTNGFIEIGYDESSSSAGPLQESFPPGDGIPAVAPFNADIDFNYYDPAFLSYRLDTTPEILARATDAVMAMDKYAQELPDFQASWTLVVTWNDCVFKRAAATAPPRITNTFQLVLVWDEAHTFAIFNYGHQMDWAGAGGNIFWGTGGDAAVVGVNAGDDVNGYMLPGSETDAISDIVRNKRLVFRVDPPTIDVPLCLPGSWSVSGDQLLTNCTECLVGFFQPNAGSVNCTACPSGQTTLNTGSDDSADCYTPGSSVLDPHFMITNPKTGERFCFDYGGKEHDVLNLVHDEKAELSIDGKLFEVGPTDEKVTYFGNIIIRTSAGTHLNFTKYDITAGEQELSWDMEDIHVGDDVVIRPLDERAQAMLVELDGGDISVVVTRRHDDIGYYLGVYLSNMEGLSSDSEGLLGQFIHSNFEVDVSNSLVIWHLSHGDIEVPVQQKERFNPAAHENEMCWVYLPEDEDNELFRAAMTHTNTHARNAFIDRF